MTTQQEFLHACSITGVDPSRLSTDRIASYMRGWRKAKAYSTKRTEFKPNNLDAEFASLME